MSKIAILGFGREGNAIYQYLLMSHINRLDIWVLDQNARLKVPAGVHKQLGKNYLRGLKKFDLIFRSPGVPYRLLNPKPYTLNPNITSLTRLFFQKCPCPVIGITGTKGKGTTATLLYLALKKSGWRTHLAGNIGAPALDLLPQFRVLRGREIVILELSSFQLQDIDRAPQMAVVVDVFPDHLDHHKNLKEYFEAKSQIAQRQTANDVIFYLADNKLSARIAKQSPGRQISVWHYISAKERSLLRKTLKLPGQHNFRNAQAALAAAKYLGCPLKKSLAAISKFKGNEHRLEFVRNLKDVRYYNDSANTDPEGTVAAARAFREPKVLIVGGKDKGLDYKIWAQALPRARIRALILMGENKNKIKKALRITNKVRIYESTNLKKAVGLAKKLAQSGDVVILSPGAASFDMFKSYADRGQKFKQLVRLL